MFKVPASNPSLKRTCRGLYTFTQATPWSGFLDSTWDKSFDIYPGTVMTRVGNGDVFRPYVGTAGTKPFGLSSLFVAPTMGVSEVTDESLNAFAVWVGGEQALFEVLAPAFDQEADWSLDDQVGAQTMLTANASGLLTPTGVTEYNAIAELIEVRSPSKIIVRLNRFDIAATSAPAGGS